MPPPGLPSKDNHQNKESIAFLHPACCWHYPDPNNQGRTTIPKCRAQSIAKSATGQKIIPPAPIRKIITTGDGAQPKASDTVTTHYRGTLIDGREFDSSIARGTPASFPVKGVIKGWTEALQLMHVGDKWELYIPSDLAYGKSKRSELIQANSTLIFELELLVIK